MSRWISKIIEDKQRRQAAGAQKHGHLHAFEGSKMVEGVIVGEPLFSRIRGCKPKPPKIPSTQFEPRHDRIQIDDLAIAVKCVVPIQMNMAPRRRRNLFEQG